jgi:porin
MSVEAMRNVAIALIALSAPAYAASQEPEPTDPVPASPAPDRSTVTNDWFGHGPAWRDAGVDLRLEWSQFYQGMTEGEGDKSWQYGGHVDALMRLDASKFTSWDSFSFTAQVYSNYGESVNGFGGTLFPLNSALFFPDVQGDDDTAIVALNGTRDVGELWSVSFGRFNNIDAIRYRPVFGGGGVDTFWNLNPAVTSSGLVPAGINAAFATVQTSPVSYSIMVYDPVDAYSKSLFKELFENGTGLNGSATLKTSVGGKTGYYGISASYSTASNPNLGDIVIDTDLGSAINDNVSDKSGAWAVALTMQQFVFQDPDDPAKGWGVFGAITTSDGNPTPLEHSFLVGFGGSSPFPNRPLDRFGLSYSRFGMSETLKSDIEPLLADEWLIEGFYNFGFSPWFRVTVNVQWVQPATAGSSKGLFAGLQTYLKF